MILSIDPGNIESAYTLIDENLKPIEHEKFVNENIRQELRRNIEKYNCKLNIVIEKIASYGMAVGASVFDTCIWIGRFTEMVEQYNMNTYYIYRKDEKMNLCHSMKAKDTNIRQALIDRFAKFDFKNGKGTKKQKDWFYGFKKDEWSAYAVGITYYDMYLKKMEG